MLLTVCCLERYQMLRCCTQLLLLAKDEMFCHLFGKDVDVIMPSGNKALHNQLAPTSFAVLQVKWGMVIFEAYGDAKCGEFNAICCTASGCIDNIQSNLQIATPTGADLSLDDDAFTDSSSFFRDLSSLP